MSVIFICLGMLHLELKQKMRKSSDNKYLNNTLCPLKIPSILCLPVTNSRYFDISPLVCLTYHSDLDCSRIPARHTKDNKLSNIKLEIVLILTHPSSRR